VKHYCLLVLLCTGLLYPQAVSAQERHTYKVTTGDKLGYETLGWKQTRAGSLFTTPESRNRYDNYRNQLLWEFRQDTAGSDLTARRTGNTIRLTGTFKRRKVDKKYTIDPRPWYQYPEYSLRDFVLSGEKRCEFWIISPNDLALFEFEACKMGTETVTLAERSVKARRVRIKAVGFYGNFWHADYWFSLQDGSYIRYEAVLGGPGTPPTVKVLISRMGD
jgi:hypothetical protein